MYRQLTLTIVDFLSAMRTTLHYETSKLLKSYQEDISAIAKQQFLVEIDLVLLESKENELLDIYESLADEFAVVGLTRRISLHSPFSL